MAWNDKPDWKYWGEKLYLDPWECTALAHELSPETYVRPEWNRETGELIEKALHVTLMPEELMRKYFRVREKFGNIPTIHRNDFAEWAISEGWKLSPDFLKFTAAPHTDIEASAKRELDSMAADSDRLGMDAESWAHWLAWEFCFLNEQPGHWAGRSQAEVQYMRTFEHGKSTLPLRQQPSGIPWPKGEKFPPRWGTGLFMLKGELRAWAIEHCPDMLGRLLGNVNQTEAKQSQSAESSKGKTLTRKAIKKIFHKLTDEQWRGLFNRETTNGLNVANIGTKGKPLYDVEKLRTWLVNDKGHYTPGEFDQAISGTKPKPEGVSTADLKPSIIHKGA